MLNSMYLLIQTRKKGANEAPKSVKFVMYQVNKNLYQFLTLFLSVSLPLQQFGTKN